MVFFGASGRGSDARGSLTWSELVLLVVVVVVFFSMTVRRLNHDRNRCGQ